jgi:hypothetical protein
MDEQKELRSVYDFLESSTIIGGQLLNIESGPWWFRTRPGFKLFVYAHTRHIGLHKPQ